jgi:hypothetical protein
VTGSCVAITAQYLLMIVSVARTPGQRGVRWKRAAHRRTFHEKTGTIWEAIVDTSLERDGQQSGRP